MKSAPTPTAIKITRRRATLANLIGANVDRNTLAAALMTGWSLDREAIKAAKTAQRSYRVARGFADRNAPMLTAPDGNDKLKKGALPSYGLTLASAKNRNADGVMVDSCEWANQCAAVCVLNRGNSQKYKSVGLARLWKTDFIGADPYSAMVLIGAELRRAVMKHGPIAFRPNVNSDIEWYALIGDAFRTLPNVLTYDYTKRPDVLDGADIGTNVVAYSYSETSDPAAALAHVKSGGRVAVVTDRRIGEPITQWAGPGYTVVDADVSDLWMTDPAVIGDLSYKRDEVAIPDRLTFVQRVGYTKTDRPSPLAAWFLA